MSATATRERIERIKAEAAELENATSDVRQFRKAKLFDELLPALTALCEEMERDIIPLTECVRGEPYEDIVGRLEKIRELITVT